VLIFILVVAMLIIALIATAYLAELQSTIAFVVDKGGLWLNYSSGIGRLRLVGFQIRMMEGHEPRAWKRRPFALKLEEAEFDDTIRGITAKKWKPIHIPLTGALDIGVNIIIRELDVKAKLGIEGDAVATALLCGSITTVLQIARAVSTRGAFVPKGYIVVKPIFTNARLSIHFKCILAIKARHIIREVVESKVRRKKNGQPSN
jgi:hypothetical protein